MQKRKLIAGNWKMNGRGAAAAALATQIVAGVKKLKDGPEVALCPPFPLLSTVGAALAGSDVTLGAQDCSPHKDGAYTGDTSADMLKDAGCHYVILGHSERREYHKESDDVIARKVAAAHGAGLHVILCVGEKNPSTPDDVKEAILRAQITNGLPECAHAGNTVIAYEPVWAIGSGLTPTNKDIAAAHAMIARLLPERARGLRILYGGSVNDKNAAEILAQPGVDGALVGGASLKAEGFLRIAAGVVRG